MRDKVYGIGISWLWMLPDTHPFHRAALYHDQCYNDRAEGKLSDETSEGADRAFYQMCLDAATGSWKLRLLARLFYRIVRAWGFFNWPTPEVKEA